MVETEEVKNRIYEEVPFQDIESILEGKLERGGERREIVEEVQSYDNKMISGGGKRFRIALPYLMAKGIDVDFEDQEIIESLIPIEMVHGLSLILDDVIDQDSMRRGMETPHERFMSYGFSEKQAESLATLDVTQLQSMAINAPHEMDFLSPKQQIQASQVLNKAIKQLSKGQVLDVAGENLREEGFETILSYEDEEFDYQNFYHDVIQGKTVPLFKAGPELLEVLKGEELGELTAYVEELGKAFQIRDDVLDISAGKEAIDLEDGFDSELVGKDRYSDLREGSLTLPIKYAFQMIDDESWESMEAYIDNVVGSENFLATHEDFYEQYGDRVEFLENVLDKEGPEKYELHIAGKIIEQTGALERANREALSYAEKAVEHLDSSEIEGRYAELLEDMAYFAATRSK